MVEGLVLGQVRRLLAAAEVVARTLTEVRRGEKAEDTGHDTAADHGRGVERLPDHRARAAGTAAARAQGLGLGTFVVGLVAGSQFAASLISRVWSGHYADSRGAKCAVVAGLLTAAVAGLLYLLSLRLTGAPLLSVTIVLLGRALLGGAESFIITGAVSWGLALVGPESAGRVIAWVGMAMFAALALGAPLGTTLYAIGGFGAVAVATTLVPLITGLLVAPLPPVRPQGGARPALIKVAGAVWMPGLGAAFSSIGFGAILAFSSLLFAERDWTPVWLAFSAYAASLIAARVIFGHLPDRLGGARVALVSVVIEAAGLALIWLASGPVMAATGAVLTGFGYALVIPALASKPCAAPA